MSKDVVWFVGLCKEKRMKRKGIGQFMLIMAALIWGSSFVVMKDAVSNLPTPMLLCIRFTLGTLFMILLFTIYDLKFSSAKTLPIWSFCQKRCKGNIFMPDWHIPDSS